MSNTENIHTGTIYPLIGIRGYFAVWVVLFHVSSTLGQLFPDAKMFLYTVSLGPLAVDMFSVLSGFIISYSYTHQLEKFSIGAIRSYAVHRFARIYPLHIFCLGLFIVSFLLERGFGAIWVLQFDSALWRQIFMVNGWGIEDSWGWNVPSWTVSVEVLCYLFFPFIVPLLARVRRSDMAIVFGCLSIVLAAVLLKALDVPAMYYATQVNWGFIRLVSEFFAGCFLYRAFVFGFGRNWNWDWVALGAIILLVPSALIWSALPVLLLAALVYSLAQGGRVIDILFSNRIAVAMGELAYSIYLVHWFVISNLGAPLGKWLGPIGLGTGLLLLMLITMVISVFTYFFVERPARRVIRRWFEGKA